MYYLGIDLGGTNIAVGIVDEENKIIARATSKTKVDNAEQVADAMAETAREALKNAGITLDDVPWIGVGSPGTINKATGIIEFANNLPFKNTPMVEMLSSRLDGKKVLMENDANAAAFGEYMAGALKGSDNAVAITLGTTPAATTPGPSWATPSSWWTAVPAPAAATAAGRPTPPPPASSRPPRSTWRRPPRTPPCGPS